MAPADVYYTARTPPGSPGWLPSIPGPPEWPLLESVAAEYLARFLDSKLAEIAINQDLMNGQLEMAFVRRPQTYVRRANGSLSRDVPIGPLPEASERVILPPRVTYGRVLDWVASKFYVAMMPDGSCKVIRPNAPSLPGVWHFFARASAEPKTSTMTPRTTPPRPDNDDTPEGRVMSPVLVTLPDLYPPDGVPPLKRGKPDELLLKDVLKKLRERGIEASEKVLREAIKFLRAHPRS